MDIRIRLRPWLESRLNEGWIDGLCWIDHEKGIFRIPWKHHSKHTWTEQDAAIFKDWAVVTGRYREGIDNPDWPMWKTRLRCALNKAPDIQEVKQRHNLHCDEPFKVYRFISKTESLWRANASRNASMIFDGLPAVAGSQSFNLNSFARRSTQPTNIFPGKRPAIFIRRVFRSDGTSRPIAVIRKTSDQILLKKLCLRTQTVPAIVERPSFSPTEATDHLDVGAIQEIAGFSNDTMQINRPLSWQQMTNSGISQIPVSSQLLRRFIPQTPAIGPSALLPLLPDIMEPEYHQLGVRMQHLNIRIKDSIVTNPNGCCIYFGRYEEINSPTAPDAIEIDISRHVSDLNRSYVNLLLENMVRGIIVTSSHGSIYIERLCKCAVFVYAISSDEYIFIRKLSRRECAKVFDFPQFMNDLEYYRVGQGTKPNYEVLLAFGQQLRPGVSTDSLLVWCRIASCRAWFQVQKVSSSLSKQLDCYSNGVYANQQLESVVVDGRSTLSCSNSYSQHDSGYAGPDVSIDSSGSGHQKIEINSGLSVSDTLNLADDFRNSSAISETVIEEGVEVPLEDHDQLTYDTEHHLSRHSEDDADELLPNVSEAELESRHSVFIGSSEPTDMSEDALLVMGSDYKP